MTTDAQIHSTIMTAHSVRSILAGTKTQTRRVVTARNVLVNGSPGSQKMWDLLDMTKAWIDPGPSPAGNPGPYFKAPRPDNDTVHRVYPRWQPGDRVWVKETWCEFPENAPDGNGGQVYYRAAQHDLAEAEKGMARNGVKWKSPIFMPREASRIMFEVVSARAQFVQDIGEDDAIAEGIVRVEPTESEIRLGLCTASDTVYVAPGVRQGWGLTKALRNQDKWAPTAREAFRIVWKSLNAKRGYSWESNPPVWAYTFRLLDTSSST